MIAANLNRLILPRQSQIWAVLHPGDSMQRLVYLLTGGLLGRLCISGEITSLNPEQWALVKEAIQFYQQVMPVIARGKSRLFQSVSPSWRHLQGAQVVLRMAEDEQSALVVTHSFGSPLPAEIRVPLPGGAWHMITFFLHRAICSRATSWCGLNSVNFSGSLSWAGVSLRVILHFFLFLNSLKAGLSMGITVPLRSRRLAIRMGNSSRVRFVVTTMASPCISR